MKTHTFPGGEYWYDRSCWSWVIRSVDVDVNQIGDADYVGTKVDRDLCIKARTKNPMKQTPECQTFITVAGRPKDLNEKADCTVRALANCADIPYLDARRRLSVAGRSHRRGVVLRRVIDKIPGLEFELVLFSPVRLCTFLKNYPDGRYIVRKSKHAFAVIEGVCFDHRPRNPREIITHAWQIKKQ